MRVTSPKGIDRDGLGKRPTRTRQAKNKGRYVMLFSIFIKRLKMSSRQMNSQNCGQVLLFRTISGHRNHFLLSVAADCRDRIGLKLEIRKKKINYSYSAL